jgi:hypothetical protein
VVSVLLNGQQVGAIPLGKTPPTFDRLSITLTTTTTTSPRVTGVVIIPK